MKKRDYNSFFVNTFARSGTPFVRGRGAYLIDAKGRKYLDFGTGIAVNALGHASARLIKELRKQGSRLLHVSNYYITPPQIEIARLLIKNSFGDRVFLCNSGTEAVEGAIKFARKWAGRFSPEKYHVLSFTDCFHGRTYGALSATSQEKFHRGFEPIVPGFHFAPFNDINGTKAILDRFPFAAIFIEPLQGEGGVNMAARKFLAFLREYADANRTALVFDEVQCGMGRTGALWCHEHSGITPDIMTVAKPVGGGLPLGAVICRDAIVECIQPGDHGTTFGGNPLACALGCVVLKEVTKKSFLRAVRDKGGYLAGKLDALKFKFPAVEGVRGRGLLLGVRFGSDPAPVVKTCKERGLLLIKAEHHTVRFLPPLTVTKKEIDKAVGIFENALHSLS
jgi:acetylornithine/N-succinyldiaminopimelate aminotransferase